jgi:DNA-binding CsgD family transcriptional regulator
LLGLDWPLTGRQEELDFIASVLQTPGQGGVVLAGGMGVGKSRLAREALARAAGTGTETVFIGATRASASIPLAAVAHLVGDDVPTALAPLGLFREVCRNLAARAGSRPLLLGVDDAHLLDDGTAALVLHIVTTGTARVLATVRSGELCPDAVTALWKQGHATRLDVGALSATDAVAMAEAHLRGPLSREARLWLMATGGGTPLLVREIVGAALGAGVLRLVEDAWQVDDVAYTSNRLVDVVEEKLGDLAPKDRRVLELVALAEPLELTVLEQLAPAGAVARLERRGLIETRTEPAPVHVRCAHPLYGEIVSSQLGDAAIHALWRELADTLAQEGRRQRGEALRLAVWRLDAGDADDPQLLTEAADEASRRYDYRLAARLADAALAAGGDLEAAMVRAHAAVCLGRPAEAEEVLARWERPPADEATGAAYLFRRSWALFWGLERTAAAHAFLDRAAGWFPTPSWRHRIVSTRLSYLRDERRYSEVVAVGATLLDEPDVALPVRRVVAANVALASTMLGRSVDALHLLKAEIDEQSLSSETPYLGPILRAASLTRLYGGREWEIVERLFRRLQPMCDGQGSPFSGICDVVLARVAVERGRIGEALHLLAGGIRRLDDAGDPYLMRSWALTTLCRAEVLAGRAGDAGATLARIHERRAGRSLPHNDPLELPLAEVQVVAGLGEVSRARSIALEAADREKDSVVGEIVLLHAAVACAGTPPKAVLDRMRDLLEATDSEWCRALAGHVIARATADGAALDEVGAAFERIGALLHAADAYGDAASVHRDAGAVTRARASAAHRDRLLDRCVGARRDVAPDEWSARLSDREREVAALAARGLTNAAIADQLYLSVRTVESHIYRACTKLGLTGREQLARFVAGAG